MSRAEETASRAEETASRTGEQGIDGGGDPDAAQVRETVLIAEVGRGPALIRVRCRTNTPRSADAYPPGVRSCEGKAASHV